MKRYLSIIALLCIYNYVQAQTRLEDTCNVYKAILIKTNELNLNHKKLILSHSTSSIELGHFDFKNPHSYYLLPKKNIFENKDWKDFLININKEAIPEASVIPSSLYSDSVVNLPLKQKIDNSLYYERIEFSPIIFSLSGNKAVVFVRTSAGMEDSSSVVYFLERSGASWQIVYTKLLGIS